MGGHYTGRLQATLLPRTIRGCSWFFRGRAVLKWILTKKQTYDGDDTNCAVFHVGELNLQNSRHHQGFICLYNKRYYSESSLTNQFELVLRDTRLEKQDSETRDSVSPTPKHQEVFQFPLQRGHSNFMTIYTNQPGEFSFLLQHRLQVTPPHPSYTLIPLSTHIPRSPSVLRFTATSWVPLTRTQRPPKTTELYVIMEPEKSLQNESHRDPRIIPPHNFFWIFEFLDSFLRGWGSHTPRAGGRLPPHSFDYTLARTGRTSISTLSYWLQRRKQRGARDCW